MQLQMIYFEPFYVQTWTTKPGNRCDILAPFNAWRQLSCENQEALNIIIILQKSLASVVCILMLSLLPINISQVIIVRLFQATKTYNMEKIS